jgi:hypothetical protein
MYVNVIDSTQYNLRNDHFFIAHKQLAAGDVTGMRIAWADMTCHKFEKGEKVEFQKIESEDRIRRLN